MFSRLFSRASRMASRSSSSARFSSAYLSTMKNAAKYATTGAVVFSGAAYLSENPALAEEVNYWGLPGTSKERTFIAVKPDGVQRGLVGEIISRFEKRGYRLVGLKLIYPTKQMAEEHYADLSSKPFFGGLTTYFSSGPIVAMCWEGTNAIKGGRQMLGATDPQASAPGSIRGDYCLEMGRNLIHGSDCPEAAEHEIKMWFSRDEVVEYKRSVDAWIYEK